MHPALQAEIDEHNRVRCKRLLKVARREVTDEVLATVITALRLSDRELQQIVGNFTASELRLVKIVLANRINHLLKELT
jgi:hypothetical protein